ncbi:helix-turn-helix domain-containing protein [Fibrivirga algicola]|uniref:Helix-turn-helix transcriptional regulator n=1 Tax=Fibrivirga algicola TaxID=2950420 RepID=A0ABX0QMN2_9BACT|nr:helix-turn-helix transcriptional regulator [Fibrivirga algicola]NID13750.1 helix-turn-helix transcriptional regulator [Fibrivirga algicola]
MSEFGQRLRQRREEVGMSQDELARRILVKSGKQTISKWEQGKTVPDLTEILRIAEVLDVTAAWLVDGTEATTSTMQKPPVGYVLMPSEEVIDMQRRLLQKQQVELQQQQSELQRQKV